MLSRGIESALNCIKTTDTVADNASFSGFAVGTWRKDWCETNPRLIGMKVQHNGQPSVEGMGAASLGHPANAVALLVNKLSEYDTRSSLEISS
jgi:2-keto-4-pentenoate hydratase